MKRTQLTFDLGRRTALGRADFVVADGNRVAVAALAAWQDWPMARMALAGPPGAGKTHLAHIWADAAAGRVLAADTLTEDAVPDAAAVPLALDDADRIAGDPVRERALFHLLNLTKETGTPLLLTGTAPPARWPVALPDLKSRVSALPLTEIAPPDDELLAALFEKLFADRQLEVGDGVVTYLVTHATRSFDAARALVAHLDAVALREKRELRLPLVREVLSEVAEDGGAGQD